MLCADLERKPRFAILVSGFVPGEQGRQAATNLLGGVCGVPSFHCIGAADDIVSPERSHALSALFDGACVHEHEKGHMVPSNAESRSALNVFLDEVGLAR